MSEEVWNERDWKEYVRMKQQVISKHSNEKGYVSLYQTLIADCQAFLKKEMDRVENKLEELRQEHGATSKEYTTMHKKFEFLPAIKDQLENMYGEVSAWELLSEEPEEPEEDEEPEEPEEDEEDEENEEITSLDERRKNFNDTYRAQPLVSLEWEIMDREFQALEDKSDDDADSQATQKRRRMDD
jgi:hypothetical protein